MSKQLSYPLQANPLGGLLQEAVLQGTASASSSIYPLYWLQHSITHEQAVHMLSQHQNQRDPCLFCLQCALA